MALPGPLCRLVASRNRLTCFSGDSYNLRFVFGDFCATGMCGKTLGIMIRTTTYFKE